MLSVFAKDQINVLGAVLEQLLAVLGKHMLSLDTAVRPQYLKNLSSLRASMSGKGENIVVIRSISPRPDSTSEDQSPASGYDEKEGLLYASDDSWPVSEPPSWRTVKQVVDFLWILMNTVSTVVIVFLNKIVFSDEQLRKCQIFVATWHFFATFLVLFISTQRPFAFFTAKRISLSTSIPLSTLFAGFLVLGNLSLSWNPIGFYQLSKVLNTPAVVLLGWVLLQRSVSRQVLGSIIAVCVGVTLTNSKLALSNPAGTAVALAAILVTALYQVWIASRIEVLNITAPQLLLNQSVVSVLILLLLAPLIDVRPDLTIVPQATLYSLLFSGVLAAFLNLSQFQVIARTSPLTFNIVSNLKTILIVSISWYTEHYILSIRDTVGVAMALGGAYAYAHYVQRPS